MKFAIRLIALCATIVWAGTILQAQTLYRSVGPDGRVTFSDQPPSNAPAERPAASVGAPVVNTTTSLPFELRQAASRYPVVLYTGPNCAPCDNGRTMLVGRGIPFQEKTITTADDADALKQLSGDTRLPLLTLGGQTLRGYSEAIWTQYLSAANYPLRSLLPGNYRRPAPVALVATQQIAPPRTAASSQAAPPEPEAAPPLQAPPTPAGNNPAGIRF